MVSHIGVVWSRIVSIYSAQLSAFCCGEGSVSSSGKKGERSEYPMEKGIIGKENYVGKRSFL